MPQCLQCSSAFSINPEDLVFYDKISPVFAGKKEPVPPPTHCPDCRSQRRMAWRNERSLYVRTCELCKKSRVSAFSPASKMHTYCRECIYSDRWDALTFGRDFDFSRNFRANLEGLFHDVPVMMLYQSGLNENCEYMNFAGPESRNCYLIFNSGRDEDCYYSRGLVESKDCSDILIGSQNQLCYECVNCSECYGTLFSQNCAQCSDSAFLFNCRRCRHCFGCTNLIQKEYHLFNKPCTPEDYQAAMKQLRSASFVARNAEELTRMRLSCIHRATNNINAEDCTGDYITASKNCKNSYEVKGAEDCQWLLGSKFCRDSYDLLGFGYDSELLYENVAVGMTVSTAFSFTSSSIPNSYYCLYCENIQNCFACVSLHHKRYCILNKQYTKEEYEALIPKIIVPMRITGDYGEFLPADMSPFGYNETIGQEYLPMTKEEVSRRGWHWSEHMTPQPLAQKSVRASLLPDSIDEIPDDILNWAIECEVTQKPFKLIRQELDFYRKMNVAVPRLHPDERHLRRSSLKNPCRLWQRPCARCGKTMSTSYATDRPETVYCEECYLAEVY